MSKNKLDNPVQDMSEEEINASAEEAIKNGTMEMVDVLGNTEPYVSIINEILTGEEKPVDIQLVLNIVKHLQGKVLTVVDATFTDEKRLKYVKDLVKDAFSSSSNWMYELSIREFEEVK